MFVHFKVLFPDSFELENLQLIKEALKSSEIHTYEELFEENHFMIPHTSDHLTYQDQSDVSGSGKKSSFESVNEDLSHEDYRPDDFEYYPEDNFEADDYDPEC